MGYKREKRKFICEVCHRTVISYGDFWSGPGRYKRPSKNSRHSEKRTKMLLQIKKWKSKKQCLRCDAFYRTILPSPAFEIIKLAGDCRICRLPLRYPMGGPIEKRFKVLKYKSEIQTPNYFWELSKEAKAWLADSRCPDGWCK